MRDITLWCTTGTHLTRSRRTDERGASVIEYALLLALIVVVCIAAIVLIGDTTDNSLSRTGSSLLG